MRTPRRSALRIVIAGPMLAGCPVHARADGPAAALGSESFSICHRLRDGERMPRAERWRSTDVAIVGGGISGLTAAWLCGDRDLVLLEKEADLGGHAQAQWLGGLPGSTGTAYVGRGDAAGALAAELGVPPRPVAAWDGTVDEGVFTPDTWGAGLDDLPYPRDVRDRFAACRRDFLALDPDDQRHATTALATLLDPYGPEVRRWWDAYCPSNWGGTSADVAASLAIDTIHWWCGAEREDGRATWPGGVSTLANRLAEVVRARHPDGVVTAATVLAATPVRDGVELTFWHDGRVEGLRARRVIMAVPKYILTRLLPDLPADQRAAMEGIRYNPYCVVNVRSRRPVHRLGYDTWFPGKRFTDCIAADWVTAHDAGAERASGPAGTAPRPADPPGTLLTCYVPLPEEQRESLLSDDACRGLAADVVADLCASWPGEPPEPAEVHLYRRGHAIHASAPGLARRQVLARRPFGRIAFAHGDVGSVVASSSGAIRAARRAVDEVAAFL